MSIKASIIVPCFNTEETIARSLQELCRQTVPPEDYQIIVVDDCSTDGTADRIASVAGATAGTVSEKRAQQRTGVDPEPGY